MFFSDTNCQQTNYDWTLFPLCSDTFFEIASSLKRQFCNYFVSQPGITKLKAELRFTAFQQNFTLDLIQNTGLFAAQYVETQEHSTTNIQPCYFHGTVRGRKTSTVSVSCCEGIEGLVNDGRISYYVKPLTRDATSRHLFYRTRDLSPRNRGTLELFEKHDNGIKLLKTQRKVFNYSRNTFKRFRRGVNKDVFAKTKYVELVIINDNKQFEAHGKNLTKTNQRAKLIANIVDSIFRPLNVRLTLVTIETWDVIDKVKADDDADTYLANLIKYRKRNLGGKHGNDVTMLLSGVNLRESVRGKAQVMSICTKRSAGIIRDTNGDAAFTAHTFAHELGHVFGMYHDDDLPHCVCNASESRGCVMSKRISREPATDFSNCSVEGFKEGLSRGLGSCLMNAPEILFEGPVCGDGILGRGEECDCGTAEECTDKGNNCCDPVTCRLHAHAQCSSGACCEDCIFKKKGTFCRETKNECDIPETCTGSSGECPENTFVQNGFSCANNSAYCYFGQCMTHNDQCRILWGGNALSGPDKCYQYHNTRGDKFGHCRKTRKGKYRTCHLQDAKCGKLWCLSENRRPALGVKRDVMLSYWPVGDRVITCKGTSFEQGASIPEMAITLEGTKCGDRKICLNRRCKSLDVLLKKVPNCSNNCSGHGLCNNFGNCYCFEPWTGKSCNEKFTDVTSTFKTMASFPTFSTAKTKPFTVTSTTRPITNSIPESSDTESKAVYIIGSLSFVVLLVILILAIRRYRRYNKQRTFVVQKKRKKTTVSTKAEVIRIWYQSQN